MHPTVGGGSQEKQRGIRANRISKLRRPERKAGWLCPWLKHTHCSTAPGLWRSQACLWVPCLEDVTTAMSHLHIHGPVNGTEDASLQTDGGPLTLICLVLKNVGQQASERTQHRGGKDRTETNSWQSALEDRDKPGSRKNFMKSVSLETFNGTAQP